MKMSKGTNELSLLESSNLIFTITGVYEKVSTEIIKFGFTPASAVAIFGPTCFYVKDMLLDRMKPF